MTGLIVIGVFAGSAVVWMTVVWRWMHRVPIIRHEFRRHVPWKGGDVLVLIAAYLFIGSMVMTAFRYFEKTRASIDRADGSHLMAEVDQNAKTAHPLTPLLTSGNIGLIALGIFLAVVKAPLLEEFMFRVVLQGWLESAWIRSRRTQVRSVREAAHRVPSLPGQGHGSDVAPSVPADISDNPYASPQSQGGSAGTIVHFTWLTLFGWLHPYKVGRLFPVLLPAIVFAMLHFHFAREQEAPTQVAGTFLAATVAEALWLCVAWYVLAVVRGATANDLGWDWQHIGYDAGLGLAAAMAIVPPLLLLSGVLTNLLQRYHVPISSDPAPIFFLALVLGILYYRTHRIMPSLVLHMSLNATSVLLLELVK